MFFSQNKLKVAVLVNCSLVLLLTGCATTAPNAKFKETLLQNQSIDSNDAALVKIEAVDGVAIEELEKQRLAGRIQEKIDVFKMSNPDSGDKREFELTVFMTRYEKGNAFARAMIAGLGRIHIDARVEVFRLPGREKVAEFEINKMFAWGGVYGAVTTVEDVEKGFAEGVAEAVTKGKM